MGIIQSDFSLEISLKIKMCQVSGKIMIDSS